VFKVLDMFLPPLSV